MINPITQVFLKGAVLLVDVQVVALPEVVADVDVRPAVPIKVAEATAQSETDLAAEDSGCLTYVDEHWVPIGAVIVTE